MGPGLTPIHPSMVTYNSTSGFVTFSRGWYLCSIPLFNNEERGNMKVWIMNETSLSSTVGTTNQKIGFSITQKYQNAEEDANLYDNSSGNVDTNSEGASRYQLVINGLASTIGLDGGAATSSSDLPKAVQILSGSASYMNNYPISSS